MSLSRYVKATLPDYVSVMGIMLKPFSVGSFLLLSRLESPFISDEQSKTLNTELLAHFVTAICICSHSYEDNIEMLGDTSLLASEIKWINKCMLRAIRKEKKKYGFNLLEKFSLFREYLKDGFKVPYWTFNNSDQNPRPSAPSKHWSEQLIEDLVSKGNRTRSEVLNLHLAAAWEAWAHIAEDNGAITLLTEEQENAIENKASVTIEGENGWTKLLAEYEVKNGKVVLP